MTWRRPPTPVRNLIRQAAQIIVSAPQEWLDELDSAVLGASPTIAADPELAAAVSRSNQANLFFWATANVRDPGALVPPNTGLEPMSVARELVRRGFDAYSLDAYRVGEGVAWRRLMDIAFELTSDPAELHEFLNVCSLSISAFVDTTLSAIAVQIDLERDELTRGTQAERRETVALILDGAPITRQRAENRLGIALEPGWRGEINLDAVAWVRQAARRVRRRTRPVSCRALEAVRDGPTRGLRRARRPADHPRDRLHAVSLPVA